MATLLFLAANPIETEGIRIDEEYREIEARLSADVPHRFVVKSKWAVRPQDLQKAMLEFNPEIVHFSGHGDDDGYILLENAAGFPEAVSPEALSDLFRSFSSSVRCVLLNACNSADQAQQLSHFIDCAVGMDGSVTVGAGRAFVTSFYQALAYGKDVGTAFDLGRNQIALEYSGEEHIPQIYIRNGLDQVLLTGSNSPVAQHANPLDAFLRAQLSLTTANLGLSERLTLSPVRSDEEPPPIVEQCSMREATIERIKRELTGRCWYAVYGGVGTGKTHLGALMAAKHRGRRLWFRLRDRTADQALSIMDANLSLIKQRETGQTRAVWYEHCGAALGPDAVLVLDDVPRTSGREDIDDSLIFLGRAARKSEILLITISSLPLPSTVGQAVSGEVFEEAAPAFTEEEVLEVLAAHGAPASVLTEGWVATVSAICRQHPLLVTEAARYFASKRWKIDSKTFDDIVTGRYAINLDTPTQEHLIRTVPDSDTRELLYRLRIVTGAFSGADVRELAALPTPVVHPVERLTSLLGLWVQRDGPDRYLVSPLVARLAGSNLSRETEGRVHEYLAARLVRNRPITALTATQAVGHYVAAGLYQNAGVFLLSSLLAYLRAKKPKDDFLLSQIWSQTPFPTQMPMALRVGIRTTQISIYLEKGKDPSLLLADLDRMLATEQLPPELVGFDIVFGGISGAVLWKRRPSEAVERIVRSLCSLRRAPSKVLGVRSKRIRANFYDTLWSAISQIKTEAELIPSLEHLDRLRPEELSQWAVSKFSDLGAEAVCNEIWMAEDQKAETDRDWERALRTLNLIGDWARGRGILNLYARSQWGSIVVLAEYLKRLEDAAAVGERAIAVCASSAKAIFWLRDIMGRQYYYVGQWQEAFDMLTQCVHSSASVVDNERAYVTALAGVTAARLKLPSALELLAQAAEIARRNPADIPAVLSASIQTELAFEQ